MQQDINFTISAGATRSFDLTIIDDNIIIMIILSTSTLTFWYTDLMVEEISVIVTTLSLKTMKVKPITSLGCI